MEVGYIFLFQIIKRHVPSSMSKSVSATPSPNPYASSILSDSNTARSDERHTSDPPEKQPQTTDQSTEKSTGALGTDCGTVKETALLAELVCPFVALVCAEHV
jgi:hypothetical protein